MKGRDSMSCYNRYRKRRKGGKRKKGKKSKVAKRRQQRKKRPIMPRGGSRRCNTHHMLWQRRYWKLKNAKALREFWYCKVDIPAETIHAYIHAAMVEIPVPKEPACERVLTGLRALDRRNMLNPEDLPSKRLELIIRLFGKGSKETISALREEQAILEEWEEKHLKKNSPPQPSEPTDG